MSSRLERVVVDGLALHRITRLITHDKITENMRERVIVRLYKIAGKTLVAPNSSRAKGSPPKNDPLAAATLITCPWCMSIWLLGGVLVLDHFKPDVWRYVADAMAAASIAGAFAEWASSYE